MREAEFTAWMKQQGYDAGTISSRISNCQRVNQFEGDLDEHYKADLCKTLVSRLIYTSEDERRENKAQHAITINGNIRTGSATLKQAVNLYVRFLNDFYRISDSEITPMGNTASLKVSSPKVVLDSYAQFLDYFGIDAKSFYLYGLENTIFPTYEFADEQWAIIKSRLLGNQPLAIRSYGRQGKNSELYLDLYRYIFDNTSVFIDPTNNSIPRKNIQIATGHKINETLYNYQCAHIFGHTKNPLLFEAIWNICFIPKIFDPLSGHETAGQWPLEYQKLFRESVGFRYKRLVLDYNHFVTEHRVRERITEYVAAITSKYEKPLIEKFTLDARAEWSEIIMLEEDNQG